MFSLLDNLDDPKNQGLITLIGGLLGGSGRTNRNFGADLGNAMQQGLLGYSNAQQNQQKLQSGKQEQTLRDLQIKAAQQADADQQKFRGLFSPQSPQGPYEDSKAQAPQMPPQPPQNFMGATPNYQPLQAMMGPKNSPMVGQPSTGKQSTFEQYMSFADKAQSAGLPEKAMELRTMAEKFRPKAKADQVTVMVNGKPTMANVMDDGSFVPIPGAPMPKYSKVDLGGSEGFFDETNGAMGPAFGKTVSPDAKLSAGVSMRGQNMNDTRQRELNEITKQGQNRQVLETPAGPILIDKARNTGSPVQGANGPIPGNTQLGKTANAPAVLSLLGDARALIPQSTGSGIGAMADVASNMVGHSNAGAEAGAKLKAIEGALLMQMPRMEGPQSDKDVANYKAAAGMLGNPTIPHNIRLAAIDAIENIQKRYAGQSPQQGSGPIRRFNPATGRIE